jgi:hypothetical protein
MDPNSRKMNYPAAELRGIRMASGLFDLQQTAGNPTQKRLNKTSVELIKYLIR